MSEHIESRRGRKRRLTETTARRRRSDFIRLWFNGELPKGHLAEHSLYYWAGTIGCRCAKRRKGAPRRERGMCSIGVRYRIYRLRSSARELNRLVLRGEDVDGDAVAILSPPRPVEGRD
jgi:hypothetical protein